MVFRREPVERPDTCTYQRVVPNRQLAAIAKPQNKILPSCEEVPSEEGRAASVAVTLRSSSPGRCGEDTNTATLRMRVPSSEAAYDLVLRHLAAEFPREALVHVDGHVGGRGRNCDSFGEEQRSWSRDEGATGGADDNSSGDSRKYRKRRRSGRGNVRRVRSDPLQNDKDPGVGNAQFCRQRILIQGGHSKGGTTILQTLKSGSKVQIQKVLGKGSAQVPTKRKKSDFQSKRHLSTHSLSSVVQLDELENYGNGCGVLWGHTQTGDVVPMKVTAATWGEEVRNISTDVSVTEAKSKRAAKGPKRSRSKPRIVADEDKDNYRRGKEPEAYHPLSEERSQPPVTRKEAKPPRRVREVKAVPKTSGTEQQEAKRPTTTQCKFVKQPESFVSKAMRDPPSLRSMIGTKGVEERHGYQSHQKGTNIDLDSSESIEHDTDIYVPEYSPYITVPGKDPVPVPKGTPVYIKEKKGKYIRIESSDRLKPCDMQYYVKSGKRFKPLHFFSDERSALSSIEEQTTLHREEPTTMPRTKYSEKKTRPQLFAESHTPPVTVYSTIPSVTKKDMLAHQLTMPESTQAGTTTLSDGHIDTHGTSYSRSGFGTVSETSGPRSVCIEMSVAPLGDSPVEIATRHVSAVMDPRAHPEYIDATEEKVTIVEVPQIQEVIREVPRKQVEIIERRVPKIDIQYVEKVVEIPEVQHVDVFEEVEEVQEKLVYVPRQEIVEVKKDIVQYVPKIEVRTVEKIVEKPKIVEVPVTHVVENQVRVPRYRDVEVPMVVAQTIQPYLVFDENLRCSTECDTMQPQIIPVDVYVPKPIDANVSFGERFEDQQRVHIPDAHWNSLLDQLNPELVNVQNTPLPYLVGSNGVVSKTVGILGVEPAATVCKSLNLQNDVRGGPSQDTSMHSGSRVKRDRHLRRAVEKSLHAQRKGKKSNSSLSTTLSTLSQFYVGPPVPVSNSCYTSCCCA